MIMATLPPPRPHAQQHLQYMVHIARFMPHVEVVRKQNVAFRRLYIRGDNGKVRLYSSLYFSHVAGESFCCELSWTHYLWSPPSTFSYLYRSTHIWLPIATSPQSVDEKRGFFSCNE